MAANIVINKKSNLPVYSQLKNVILKKIEAGEFSTGSPIPSEREMSEALSISRMTVRQALNQLVSEGILYRERGRGTFVSKTKFVQRNVMSFSETVLQRGLSPFTQVLHFSKIKATQDISELLEINNNDFVYNLKRLRLANDIPIGIEEVFIPEKYCPNFDMFDLTASLYKLMRDNYAYTISYIDNVIESTKPAKEESRLLDISANTPVLRANSINYTNSGVKLFFERSAYRSDEYKYSVRVYINKDME